MKRSLAGLVVILIISLIGLILALQGWRSRFPGFDLVLDIDNAHALVSGDKIPDRGVLVSYASHSPPGTAWLMAPGVLLFKDPRLFDYVGAGALYIATLVGIFLLARLCFGNGCALLAVVLFGLSEFGLNQASSLWHKHPLSFFYVWTVYWTIQWVRKRDARYLAAAVVMWAAGMYAFMEVAPAVFVFPVAWYLYRPPLRVLPIVVSGILSLAIWYPYLRFEQGRGFADVKSQVQRKGILPANYRATWCDPGLTVRDMAGTPTLLFGEKSAPAFDEPQDFKGRIMSRYIYPALGRREFIISGLSSNFDHATTTYAGIGGLLTLLSFIGLIAVCAYGGSLSAKSIELAKAWLPRFGIALIAVGLLFNEFVIARYLSAHGVLQASTVSSIRWLQTISILSGIVFLTQRAGIGNLLKQISARAHATSSPEHARLLVLSLIIPWAFLLALVEDTTHLERFWWLWSVQVVILSASITYVLPRFKTPRVLVAVAGLLVVIAIADNSVARARLQAWHETGWAGNDPDEVQAVDYLASRVTGKNHAAIGYQMYIWTFMAAFNAADSRYKVGADFDLLLKDRHGISNVNRCAEGISPVDEFRVVETRPSWSTQDPRGKGYFDVPQDKSYRLLRQFGIYQILQRDPALTSAASK